MMEERNLIEYYSEVANVLDDMIPCGWKKISLYAKELGDWRFLTFYFYTDDDKIHHWGDIPDEYGVDDDEVDDYMDELSNIIKKIWLEFKEYAEEPWTSFEFDIDSDWKFKVNFRYEEHRTLSGIEIETRWAYDKFAIIPQENAEKFFLKEYLEEQGKELPEELKDI